MTISTVVVFFVSAHQDTTCCLTHIIGTSFMDGVAMITGTHGTGIHSITHTVGTTAGLGALGAAGMVHSGDITTLTIVITGDGVGQVAGLQVYQVVIMETQR